MRRNLPRKMHAYPSDAYQLPRFTDGQCLCTLATMISMPQIQRYCDAIAAAFKPAKIFLFGSYAYGEPTEDSDVDVMVVMPKGRKATLDTAVKIQQQVPAPFPVDVLVRGELEMERRLRERDMFTEQVTLKGKLMYETVHA